MGCASSAEGACEQARFHARRVVDGAHGVEGELGPRGWRRRSRFSHCFRRPARWRAAHCRGARAASTARAAAAAPARPAPARRATRMASARPGSATMPRPSISASQPETSQAAPRVVDGPDLAVGHHRDAPPPRGSARCVPSRPAAGSRAPWCARAPPARTRRRRRWRARCRACSASSRWPRRILADTGIAAGTARRTAATIACTSSGSSSSTAPPRCRLTVGAGQPKLRSMPSGPSAASARRVVGQAGRVRAEQLRAHRRAGGACGCRCASSGIRRRNTRSGSNWSVTRMNSDTQRSTPPTRVSTSRRLWSSRPSIGARRISMGTGV